MRVVALVFPAAELLKIGKRAGFGRDRHAVDMTQRAPAVFKLGFQSAQTAAVVPRPGYDVVPGIAPGGDKLFNIGLAGALTHGRNGQLDAFGHGFVVVGLADIYIIAQSTAVSGRKRDRGVACLCCHGQVRFRIDCRSHGRGQRCRFRPRCACHGHSLPRDIQIDGSAQRGRSCHGYGARGFGQLFSIFHADHAEARIAVVFKKRLRHEVGLRTAAEKLSRTLRAGHACRP